MLNQTPIHATAQASGSGTATRGGYSKAPKNWLR